MCTDFFGDKGPKNSSRRDPLLERLKKAHSVEPLTEKELADGTAEALGQRLASEMSEFPKIETGPTEQGMDEDIKANAPELTKDFMKVSLKHELRQMLDPEIKEKLADPGVIARGLLPITKREEGKPSPTSTDSDTKKGTEELSEQRKSPEARVALMRGRGRIRMLSGPEALDLSAEVIKLAADYPLKEIGKQLKRPAHVIQDAFRIRTLNGEMKQKVLDGALGLRAASFIARYPAAVQTILGNAYLEGKICQDEFSMGSVARGTDTLRQRFEKAGLQWPADTDDNGRPLSEEGSGMESDAVLPPGPRRGKVYVGSRFLEILDELNLLRKPGVSAKTLASQIGVPQWVVHKLLKMPDFAPGMRELIRRYKLSPEIASEIAVFPDGLWRPITAAWISGEIMGGDLIIARYWRARNEGSLRNIFARVGFVNWPRNLDDEGNPK